MKAITIKQPWATLIALGEKKFETRSWKTKHRGQIAIHAGKSIDLDAYCEFADVLQRYGYESHKDLPTGAIISLGTLSECHKVVREFPLRGFAETDKGIKIEGVEYSYGFYEKGRYAWELQNVTNFIDPVPAKGQLSLWNWDEGSK